MSPRPVKIRCVFAEESTVLELEDNERVVGADHEGTGWWIYIETTLDVRAEQ